MQVACAVSNVTADVDDIKTVNNEAEWCTSFVYNLNRNQTAAIEKFVSFYATVDNETDIVSKAKSENEIIMNQGFSALEKNQEAFWREYWVNGDVSVKGCDKDQQAIRFSLFHLRQQLANE